MKLSETPRFFGAVIMLCATLQACTLAPAYKRPPPPVPQAWPLAGALESAQPAQPSAADLDWRTVFPDAKLQAVIALALNENRDLRVAAANIVKARAQYRVQRADLLPTINATGAQTRSQVPASVAQTGVAGETDQFSANIGLSYELDVFGRARSLSKAALQSYFAVEENRRTVQISLIAETATTYLTLAADQERLTLAQDTLKSRDQSQWLFQKRFEAGATSQLEVSQAATLTEQARSDVAAAIAQVAQDRNALRLVVGADIPPDLLPNGGLGGIQVLQDLPPGLPSGVLIRRPDVLAAEHTLRAQNANIGAARAAFFPRISLTGSTGVISPELDGLFGSGSGAWSFSPQITLPLFSGGANLANLRGAKASREIAVAQYEKAIQSAFRDVADALAVRSTIKDRISSQERLAAAAADALRLSQARYDSGVDGFLTLLDAQRTNYSAQQSLLAAKLLDSSNRATLYRALGGGAAR